MITPVGIQVFICRGSKRVLGLPDPAGGQFDAAGDFDRLLPPDAAGFPILGQIDQHGDLELYPASMPGLITEIDQLLPAASPGPERNGLTRLRALAQHCADNRDTALVFLGD